ncbi:hypothetical protein CDQ91_19790 [Sphingopyxis witflariensis]|uniref:Uncharacterized protein n=1 Tax=Sphingopyxis witflariensis TaxID=173675 RepID=A0A246JEL7_9SPHN|nr:hypothetical protein CDQ91_19790 [Sphingopyxis witflariensis]
MAAYRKYYVWGLAGGEEIGPTVKPSLEAAARTANKMIDQGLTSVRVTDREGTAVSAEKLDLIWKSYAERSLIKRRRMDGR